MEEFRGFSLNSRTPFTACKARCSNEHCLKKKKKRWSSSSGPRVIRVHHKVYHVLLPVKCSMTTRRPYGIIMENLSVLRHCDHHAPVMASAIQQVYLDHMFGEYTLAIRKSRWIKSNPGHSCRPNLSTRKEWLSVINYRHGHASEHEKIHSFGDTNNQVLITFSANCWVLPRRTPV